MRVYEFSITGASPYDGIITIVANHIGTARKLAKKAVKRYNENCTYSDIKLTGVETSEKFDPPCIVHFESGEA